MATGPTLGTKIKRARERKRWTQQQLAEALGVNIKSVDNWENDRTTPRSAIGALEDILGVSLTNGHDDDGGSGARPSVTYEEAIDRAEEALDLLRQVARERQEGNAHETRRRRRAG